MNRETEFYKSVLILLSKRYRIRMRQIKNRRKMTHQIMIQKYMQYTQSSQQLFQSYALKVLELFEPPIKCSKKYKICETWWLTKFPELTPPKFLRMFHISRKLFNHLCEQLKSELVPVQRNEVIIPVEKIVALGLYKLATGDTNKKSSRVVGVHVSAVHKMLINFLKAVLYKFGDNLNPPNYKECEELSQKTFEWVRVTDVVGALIKKQFSAKAFSIPDDINLLGIVDIQGRIRYVRTESVGKEDSYYQDLKFLCCPPSFDTLESNPNYFIITDDKVPDFECFVQRDEAETESFSRDMDRKLMQILTVKENAFHQLVTRWGTLRGELDYLPPMTTLVVLAAVALHNLCVDFGELFTYYDGI